MYIQWPTHDPGDSLDYGLDWSRILAPGDTITSSSWSAPASITISVAAHTDTTTIVWLTGGSPVDSILDIQNRVVTAQGRVHVKTIALPIGHH